MIYEKNGKINFVVWIEKSKHTKGERYAENHKRTIYYKIIDHKYYFERAKIIDGGAFSLELLMQGSIFFQGSITRENLTC